MQEGTRFDLLHYTMPWDSVDTVIFDIGNILIRFVPEEFVQKLFPGDARRQQEMMERVYKGKYWLCFDRGVMTYDEAARLLAEEYGEAETDYLHALRGWFALKTPIEEGWRAARRCKRAGKKLYLLSNYPQRGYEHVRKEYESYFGDLFDGGIISCYEHQIKPDKEIYETLIERYGLDPARSVFIDDTLVNVEGAMKTGIHGFHMHESGMMDRFFL